MSAQIEKLNANEARPGSHGEALHIEGEKMALRTWREGPTEKSDEHAQDYETLGYVIAGEATLFSGDDVVHLTPGDSWRVPAKVMHRYVIPESFEAVEVTSPPARGTPFGAHDAH